MSQSLAYLYNEILIDIWWRSEKVTENPFAVPFRQLFGVIHGVPVWWWLNEFRLARC